MKTLNIFFFLIAAFLTLSFTGEAQSVRENFFNTTYGAAYGTDTTTNAGTGSVKSAVISGGGTSTTVVVTVTKLSGTVGGTLTLLGSLDGTNYKALTTPNTATALATYTATDATNRYVWILSGNPFRYYKVEHAGTGTMSSTLDADILKH
ncbi:MAG TPA: hypothetical protein VD927_06670 [Chryseosolibacter sp.]|nr:hypothetical protein [Chryseosolibacter sp.]